MKRGPRSHFRIINGVEVAKKTYSTEKDAIQAARFINSQENTIHKMVAYKCMICEKWHIGSNGRELTKQDKESYRKLL